MPNRLHYLWETTQFPLFYRCHDLIPPTSASHINILSALSVTSSALCCSPECRSCLGPMILLVPYLLLSLLVFCLGPLYQKWTTGSETSDSPGFQNWPPSLSVVRLGARQTFWQDKTLAGKESCLPREGY